jgi:hypothetical protein
MGRQQPVRAGDAEVVVLDRGEDGIKLRPSSGRWAASASSTPTSSWATVMAAMATSSSVRSSAFSGDHDRRVEDQPIQSRSSVVSEARSLASSSGHDESEAWSRSSRLTSRPLTDGTGVMRAIACRPG